MGAKIKKAYGRSKATMIAGIVLLAAAVILMLIGAFRYGAEKKNVPHLEDIIQEKGTDKLSKEALPLQQQVLSQWQRSGQLSCLR